MWLPAALTEQDALPEDALQHVQTPRAASHGSSKAEPTDWESSPRNFRRREAGAHAHQPDRNKELCGRSLRAAARRRERIRAQLEHFLRPTKLLPTGGIVKTTATEITSGANTDLEKARAHLRVDRR